MNMYICTYTHVLCKYGHPAHIQKIDNRQTIAVLQLPSYNCYPKSSRQVDITLYSSPMLLSDFN